jgi:hypothetical protein
MEPFKMRVPLEEFLSLFFNLYFEIRTSRMKVTFYYFVTDTQWLNVFKKTFQSIIFLPSTFNPYNFCCPLDGI